MKPAWLNKFSPAWQARLIRIGFNLFPAFRGTGGRMVHVAPDFRHMRVELPLNWRTKNVVGSIYGGSLFAVTDGPHPLMLMIALGDDFVVWDKAANIRYRRPGYSTVYADFVVTEAEIAEIRAILQQTGELERSYFIDLKDDTGEVHARVERIVYIADKVHYQQKMQKETNND